MKSTVMIRSNKNYGITVILDSQIPFSELVADVEEKFRDSGKFFEQSRLAVEFDGRKLTEEEEDRLVRAITDNCNLDIVCIIDHNQEREEHFRQALMKQKKAEEPSDSGQFYKGILRSGQVLESEHSVVILGDVNPGAKVIAVGNIIVLGALKGTACAGITGNDRAVVVALEMNPVQIRISNVIARSTDKKAKAKKAMEPQIAFVEDGNIYIDALCKEVLNELNWW